MKDTKYIGLDVHQATISVAVVAKVLETVQQQVKEAVQEQGGEAEKLQEKVQEIVMEKVAETVQKKAEEVQKQTEFACLAPPRLLSRKFRSPVMEFFGRGRLLIRPYSHSVRFSHTFRGIGLNDGADPQLYSRPFLYLPRTFYYAEA